MTAQRYDSDTGGFTLVSKEANITVLKQTGITSAAAIPVFSVPASSAIAIYPTAAGVATVLVSTSSKADCEADILAGNFDNITNSARWQEWTPGAVTALAYSGVDYHLSCIVCKVTSGTWVLEVTR